MARPPYIAIEGVIGVGKTTLTRLLQPRFEGDLVLEVFEENPFLSNFYGDRARYAFQTQIFFLLSRYRQQMAMVPPARRKRPIISDYTFAKDRLFAQLNLSGDELAMYERVHDALGAHLQHPDLLVYLRADHDVLMARIAARDRPYERNMDPQYIEELRLAYEDFITAYEHSPVLIIDTNELNIIQDTSDLDYVVQRIQSSAGYGIHQTALPGVDMAQLIERRPESILEELETRPGSLLDFQQFHISLDADKGFDSDLLLNFTLLMEEIGELARVVKHIKSAQIHNQHSGLANETALIKAIEAYREQIKDELADCFAYLLKISNYTGIDLEDAYLQKMNLNAQREWPNGKLAGGTEEATGGN